MEMEIDQEESPFDYEEETIGIDFSKRFFNGMNQKNEKVTDKYNIIKKIGAGGFGQVFELEYKATNDKRACKVLSKRNFNYRFAKERDILLKLDHPNISKLYEIYEDNRFYYMIMDLCTGGELFERIIEKLKNKELYSEIEVYQIFKQLMMGVNYCHENGICHRDLKPENLLFYKPNDQSSLKIIDFGLSKDLKKSGKIKMKKKYGTCFYIAPEVLIGNYSIKCDIWSAGVIFYLLFSGDPPFNGKTTEEVLKKVIKGEYSFPEERWKGVTEEAKDLIKKMLCPESQRLSAKEVLEHPWFQMCENAIKSHNPDLYKPILFNSEGFCKYVHFNKLKKLAYTYIADRLKEEDILKLKDMFLEIDKDKNGTISYDEFKEGLKSRNLDEQIMKKMFKSADTDKSGVLDYTEFIASLLRIKNNIREVYLRDAFVALDVNNDGKITKEDIMTILKLKEGDKKAEKVSRLVDAADTNHDGHIDYEEFLNLMLNEAN